MQVSALFYLGAILLVIGLVTNLVARLIVRRFDPTRTRCATDVPAAADTRAPRRRAHAPRRFINRVAEVVALIAALAAVAVLGIVVWSVAKRGASQLSLDFLTKDLPLFGQPGGGIAPLIVGSAILVGIADADRGADRRADRASSLTSSRRQGWVGDPNGARPDERPALDHHLRSSSSACSSTGTAERPRGRRTALAIVMLPLVARATQEVLAAGAEQPAGRGARARGEPLADRARRRAAERARRDRHRQVLAVARAAGETAPLLFVTSIYANTIQSDPRHALPNMPVQIFIWSESADPQRSRARLGDRAGADRVRARDEPVGRLRAGAEPPEHDPMIEEEEVTETVTMPPMRPVDVAEREERPAARRSETRLRAREPDRPLRVESRAQGRRPRDPAEPGHRGDRPLGLRQEHVHPLPEPDERHDRRLQARRPGALPRHRPLRRRRRAGRGAPTDRDGLPAAEPVPEDDLRQRRLGAARARA